MKDNLSLTVNWVRKFKVRYSGVSLELWHFYVQAVWERQRAKEVSFKLV